MNTTTQNPLDHIDPEDIKGAWTARHLDRITDAELLRAGCQLLSIARDETANSFTLHAPLELMARAELLRSVSAQRRQSARQRIALIAATWSTTGGPIATSDSTAMSAQPFAELIDALRHGDLSIDEARRQLLPIAAMSMLQDAPTNAPYGWTHCFTLPQATLAVVHRASDAQRAVDVAATYVLGYRATQSSGPIDPRWEPDPPSRLVDEVMYLDPFAAAATAWHAQPHQRARIAQQLVDHAAPHHDAHLAKYTLACFDAATQDPSNARLYLAAAAYLAAWWHQHDHTTGAAT